MNCVVCQRPLNRRGHCPAQIQCNFEGRVRLGIPLWQAQKLRGEEYEERNEERRKRKLGAAA